ncbi:hypothetical protein I204_06644 [Kwoniella mangroviensis CBS 8886]|nr:hypothetical protein I204_06644 [Kwoniella mangroviensis CBS 8886]
MAVHGEVNLLLLIELAAVVIGASAFLFYWNRLLGSIVALIIRLYTWRNYNAYIVIGSLQIAPLAGRISFRDVEYHSSNISVRALHGHVTWRYWKFRIRHETDSQYTNTKRNKLPCRITVFAEGVEAFVFNRTPAYDAIVERMKKHEREEAAAKGSPRSSDDINGDPDSTLRSRLKKVVKTSTRGSATTKAATSENGFADHQPDHHNVNLVKPTPVKPASEGVNWFREALPIDIKIVTGSLILGSDATPMVLIGDFKRAEGMMEVTDSRSTLDLYKTAINLTFHNASVLMRTNVDYSGPLLAHGKKVYDELLKRQPDLTSKPPSALSIFTGFHLLSKQFRFIHDPKFSTPPVAGLPTDKIWKGLARYREPESGEAKGPKREEREYAKVTTLLETPKLEFTYYADTPGVVPLPSEAPYIDDQDQIGNVDIPPEYGIDITIHKGNVKYGPWADKQREAIQRAFAPSLFFDSEIKPKLRPGDTRVHTTLVLHLLLQEETVMRIPTREPSKDWQYDNAPADVERRYGWLDVVVGPNSSISYTQDQVATKQGYDSMLVLQLDSIGISSSVNLDTFIKAKTCKLSMTMPTPLEWDAQRDWGMDVTLDTASISLLRDHVTLISDLSKDWSSGATGGDYHHFVPNHYNFRVSLINYDLHLYINDYNIVDAPWSRDSNAFMDVYGPRMDAYVAVASTQYRPETSSVPFSVSLSDARVELCVPKWDTHRAFGPDVTEIGKIGDLTAKGSYLYYSIPKPDHQETLDLHLEGKHVVFKAFGWVLRRLFCIKDNYFGTFTQFRTMQEYLEKFDHDPDSVGDPIEEKYRPGRSDPFAVFVTMNVEESLVLMSDEIYNCRKGLVIPVPQLQMNLKSVDHFMDLSLDAPPTYVTASPDLDSAFAIGGCPSIAETDIIFIEGIEVKANRLFGPQPQANTYLCLWEIVIPKVSAFMSPSFVSILRATGRSVGYTFSDPENGPSEVYVPKSAPDVTFFKVTVDEAIAMLSAGDYAISVEMPSGLSLDTSTLGTRSYSSMMDVSLPSLIVNMLERRPKTPWQSVGSARAGAAIDLFKAPSGWREAVTRQQHFIRKEDEETSRIWYMYEESKPSVSPHVNGLYLPQPMLQSPEGVCPSPVLRSNALQLIITGQSADDDSVNEESERSTIGSAHDEIASSSASSSGNDIGYRDFDQSRLRNRRSRSFATARETPDNSTVGEESDTDSRASSIVESISSNTAKAYGDIASAMETKLRSFHTIHMNNGPFAKSDGSFSVTADYPSPVRSIDDGTIIRIKSKAICLDLTPTSIPTISTILTGLSAKDEGFEKRLDALLAEQLSAAEEESKINVPTVLDLRLPSVGINLSTGGKRQISLATQLQGISCHLSQYAPRNKQAIFDVSAKVSTITLVTLAPISPISDICLRDVSSFDDEPFGGVPVLKAAMQGLEIAAHHSQGVRLHTKVSHATIDTVTLAFETIFTLIQPWQESIRRIQMSKPSAASDAHVLYTILQKVIEHGYDAYLPAFAYERAYGLHVQDCRNVRTQSGWWLLARFRDWYRRIPAQQPVEPELPMDQMAEYTINQLCRVEDTVHGAENVIREQYFIQRVFGNTIRESTNTKQKEKAMDLFFYSENLKISHHGHSLGSKKISSSSIFIDKASIGGSKATGRTDDRPITQIQLVVAVQDVRTDIQDSILGSIRAALEQMPEMAVKTEDSNLRSTNSNLVVIGDGQIGTINLDVHGGGLRLHFGANDFHLTSLARKSVRLNHDPPHRSSKETVNATCASIELSLLQIEETQNQADRSSDRIIVYLKSEGLSTLYDNYHSTSRNSPFTGAKIAVGLKLLDFDSRPQLRAFYAFVQAWKEKELPLYAANINEIRSIVSAKIPSRPESGRSSSPLQLAAVDVAIEALHMQVRAAKALWLRWDIGKIYASRQHVNDNVRFAIQVAPQVVGAYASIRKHKSTDSSALRLPSITIIGDTKSIDDRAHVSVNIELGFFTGVLKPVILDRLLSLHQQLAADITEFVNDWHKDVTRAINKRHTKGISMASVDTASSVHPNSPGLLFDIHIGVAGLRIGLRADDVATTLLFEALAVKGRATNHLTEENALHWRAKIDHFGLSLGHLGSEALSNDTEPVRTHRTAYMLLDAEVHEVPPTPQSTSRLNINLSRVHTVMHPEALSELTDLLKSWMSDLHTLRDHRSAEVAEVKVHTSRVLRRLESAEKVERSEKSWFANRLVFVEVSGIGIAIPLVEGAAIGDTIHSDLPALLYSIRVISFQNRRNETARFKVQNMVLQFIRKFDQSSSEHFTGDFHESVNRMTLPSIDMEAQMSSTPDIWQLSAHCSATDFKLSLSPEVADGVYKLIDLFHHGKERITKLEAHYKSEMAKHPYESVSAKYDDPSSPAVIRPSQRILVRMSYTFNSGIVELHRGLSESERMALNADIKKSRQWHDTVVLPTVSLWMDYSGPQAMNSASDDNGDSDALLLFNAAVHESRNLLRPTILPFFVQVINRMEGRAKHKVATSTATTQPRPESIPASISEQSVHTMSRTPMEKIRLRFTLRIDKSRLRLSCAPDSNAYVDLKWESGGFLASTTIGGNDVTTVAGTISDVTAYLRHEFAEEGRSCIEAGAKDMAFTIAHRLDDGNGHQKGLSIVLDTQLSGQFRLEQFSAWLTFAAVWIDSAPPLDLPPKSAIVEAATSSAPALAPVPNQQKLAIVALIRFRSIDLDANVGVTNAKLELTPIVLRTISNGEFTEVDLDIGVTQLTAKGDISGDLRSEHLNFHTSRQSSRSAMQAVPTVLSMAIDAGDLTGSLLLQELKVIIFHLEPATVKLADDWKAFNDDQNSQVNLSFTVETGVFRAIARLLAIPSLVNKVYSITNTFDSQERVASQRSKIYKSTKLRKSTEPSPMAAAILHTARKAGQSMNTSGSVRTSQTMRFDLGGIELGIFNAPVTDEHRGDFYRFMIGKCETDLKRQLSKEGLPKRDLSVLVSFVSWDTSDGPRAAKNAAGSRVVKEMIESASKHGKREIAWLPLVTMTMHSIEEPRPPVIVYDFDLIWGEGDGDVAILPYFFEQAYKTFDAFTKGLEQEQITKAKRRGEDKPVRRNTSTVNFDIKHNPNNGADKVKEEDDDDGGDEKLTFRTRLAGTRPLPVPRLRLLGEGTRQAMVIIPRINEFSEQLPIMVHKGITSPLEDGMDLLLKLYEKQLPDRAT